MTEDQRAKWNNMGTPRAEFFTQFSDATLEDVRCEFSLDSPQSRYAVMELERRSTIRRTRNEWLLIAMTAVILLLTVWMAVKTG
jgi:hypothetical protein